MGGSIQVPNNIEDKTVLKRFLTDLVLGINGNTLFSGNVQEQNAAIVELLNVNPNMDFLNIVAKLNELRTDILTYVSDNIETVILQNTEDVAVIAEQFGTFYNQALAASWYGLSVKAGGAVAGLEVGSLDPDVTTPGDESSYFRVVANNFILGRAYEDLTQAEKNYLAANNLPSFGTVYNAQKQPVPALVTTWDGAAGVYKHYFNGIVQFTNIANADYANAINNGTTTINGGRITTGSITASQLAANTITASQIAANTITASQIAANTITAYNLNTNSINLSTLTGSINWNTQILNKPSSLSSFTNDSGFVTGSYSGFTYIDAYGIYTGNITANQITTGTLNASLISVTNLNASNITTGTLTVLRLPQISDTKSITSTSTVTYSNSYVSILSLGSFGTTVSAIISGTVNFPSRTGGLGSTIALSVNGTIVFEYTFPNIGANSFSYTYTGNINSVSISVKNNEALSTTVTSRNLSVVSFFK